MADEVEYNQLCDVLYSEEKRWNDTGHAFTVDLKDSVAWLPPFLGLMWLTGGRVSEVLCVRGSDIKITEEGNTQVVTVTLPNLKQRKNAEKKCLFIPSQYPVVWSYIENYIVHLENPTGLLFHRSRKTVYAHCKRIWGFGPHKAGRHSWMMNQARRGMSLLDAKQLGGWKSLTSMGAYISEFGQKELTQRMLKLPPGGTK